MSSRPELRQSKRTLELAVWLHQAFEVWVRVDRSGLLGMSRRQQAWLS